jgi:hypothetical protein
MTTEVLSDRIAGLGSDVEVLLDDREWKFFDFRIDGIAGVFRIHTAKVTLPEGVNAALRFADKFRAFADADIVEGEATNIESFFRGLPSGWKSRPRVAWYSMSYAQDAQPKYQMHKLYEGKLNSLGVSVSDRGTEIILFHRDL